MSSLFDDGLDKDELVALYAMRLLSDPPTPSFNAELSPATSPTLARRIAKKDIERLLAVLDTAGCRIAKEENY